VFSRCQPAVLFPAGWRIGKNDHHQAPQRLRFLQALDHEVYELFAVAGFDFQSLEHHGAFLPECFLEGLGEFVAQVFPGHDEDIPIGLARGRLQEVAGSSADVKDVALFIDEHGG
jgi:hypothetical protein